MQGFQPNTSLYGMQVIRVSAHGEETPIGTLEEITGPHSCVVSGVTWEHDTTDDFDVEDGVVYLIEAWRA